MPANCSAGIYLTPCFDANHVVPQKKQTRDKANNAFARVPFFRIVNGLKTESCLKESLV